MCYELGKFFILIVFILLFSVGCSNNKINVENSLSVEDGSQVIYDELKAEFVGYANQFVLRTTYILKMIKLLHVIWKQNQIMNYISNKLILH